MTGVNNRDQKILYHPGEDEEHVCLRWTCDTQVQSSHGQPEVPTRYLGISWTSGPSPFLSASLAARALITTWLMLFAAGYLNCRLISHLIARAPSARAIKETRERTGETYITHSAADPRDVRRVRCIFSIDGLV